MARFIYDSQWPDAAFDQLDLVSNSGVLRSVLSGGIQTIARDGQHWTYQCTWQGLLQDDFGIIVSYLSQLNGAQHRALLPIFHHRNLGAGGGTPVVDGAGQLGNQLNITGAPINTNDYLLPGDLLTCLTPSPIQVMLRRVVAPVNTDAAGKATVDIVPPLRTSPEDGSTIDIDGRISHDWILTSAVSHSQGVSQGFLGKYKHARNITATFVGDTI